MVNVFLTVDTELWPCTPDWRESCLSVEMDRYIYGYTPKGDFGIPFQMDLLNEYNLKAVFFVEPLFACAVGLEPLRKIVELVRDRGHEIQLHLHTEWLRECPESILPGKTGQHLKDFTEDQQALLIARGVENLRACGAPDLCAFRAGNYGANFDTLRALARNAIRYDTSYNLTYLGAQCGIQTPVPLLQPEQIHGVYEFPISFFRDWPGHYRHAQLCACSSQELENALLEAWRHGWYSFVIVSHSFELLKRPFQSGRAAVADRIVIRRYERLCRFLAKNREKFNTAVFSEIDPHTIPAVFPSHPLRSNLCRTTWRFAEQVAGRVLS